MHQFGEFQMAQQRYQRHEEDKSHEAKYVLHNILGPCDDTPVSTHQTGSVSYTDKHV